MARSNPSLAAHDKDDDLQLPWTPGSRNVSSEATGVVSIRRSVLNSNGSSVPSVTLHTQSMLEM